jgi:hypothetical protein
MDVNIKPKNPSQPASVKNERLLNFQSPVSFSGGLSCFGMTFFLSFCSVACSGVCFRISLIFAGCFVFNSDKFNPF